MLRKTLTLGMVFILALSLLVVSMITCFTYEAEAHLLWWCEADNGWGDFYTSVQDGMECVIWAHVHGTGC